MFSMQIISDYSVEGRIYIFFYCFSYKSPLYFDFGGELGYIFDGERVVSREKNIGTTRG